MMAKRCDALGFLGTKVKSRRSVFTDRKGKNANQRHMNASYVYSLSGRRPATMFALVAAGAFVAIGLSFGAPWFALGPALIVVPLVLYTILANPVYGMRIDRQAMEIDRNGKIKRILLSAIDYIKITGFSEGSDATIHLRDGTLHQIPQMTRPPTKKFREVLSEFGIAVNKA